MKQRLAWVVAMAIAAFGADAGAQEAPATTPTVSEVGDASYRVDVGDVLKVTVYGEADLSGQILVGEKGIARFPLLGEVPIGGLTTAEVAQELERRLGERFLQDPQVNVRMDVFASRPVRVLGAVEKPGIYYLRGDTSVLEMLAIAGDVDQENGPIKEVQLRRGDRTIRLNLDKLMASGDGDVQLESGDVLYVPEGLVVYVAGQVEEPGEVAFAEGLTVSRALAKAGGPKPTARLNKAYVMRDGEKIAVSLKAILKGREPDFELQPGDQLMIEESVF